MIGLSWASPLGVFPGLKSLQLNDFAPLFKIKNGLFVDLQYGDTAEERNEFQTLNGASILHDSDIDQLTDINTFSAQVAAMDFVFTVSNSVAHLAGALGVPTAVLLSSAPQWKWSGNRPDSMWYSDVQLVRRDYGESVEKQISSNVAILSQDRLKIRPWTTIYFIEPPLSIQCSQSTDRSGNEACCYRGPILVLARR